jgi:hypothetical protein
MPYDKIASRSARRLPIRKVCAAALTTVALVATPAMAAEAAVDRNGALTCPGGARLVGMHSWSGTAGYHRYDTATQYAQVNFNGTGDWVSGSPFTSARWHVHATSHIDRVAPSCY